MTCENCGKEGAKESHTIIMTYEVHLEVHPITHTDMNAERPTNLCRKCTLEVLRNHLGLASDEEVRFYT